MRPEMTNHRHARLGPARSASLTSTDLVARLVTVPGMLRPGISSWDMKTRLPLHPLAVENAYGDPRLLHAIATPGATFAHRLGVDVIVGAETGGIPTRRCHWRATCCSRSCASPDTWDTKNTNRGSGGAAVKDRRVLLVDDAVSEGNAIEAFASQLRSEGATVVGVFVVVDMRDVAPSVTPAAAALPIESIATYLQVLATATELGVLDPNVHRLAVESPRQPLERRRPSLVAPRRTSRRRQPVESSNARPSGPTI